MYRTNITRHKYLLVIISLLVLATYMVPSEASSSVCYSPNKMIIVPVQSTSYSDKLEIYLESYTQPITVYNISSSLYDVKGAGCINDYFIVMYLDLTNGSLILDYYDINVLGYGAPSIDLGKMNHLLIKRITFYPESPAIISAADGFFNNETLLVLGISSAVIDNGTISKPFSIYLGNGEKDIVKKYYSVESTLKLPTKPVLPPFFYNVTEEQLTIGTVISGELELMKTSIPNSPDPGTIVYYPSDNKRLTVYVSNSTTLTILYTDKATLTTNIYLVGFENYTLISVDGIISLNNTFYISSKAITYAAGTSQPETVSLITLFVPSTDTITVYKQDNSANRLEIMGYHYLAVINGTYLVEPSISDLNTILAKQTTVEYKLETLSTTSAFLLAPSQEASDFSTITKVYAEQATTPRNTTSTTTSQTTQEKPVLNMKLLALVIAVVIIAVAGILVYFLKIRKRTVSTGEEEESEQVIELNI
ncbi:MAG: hypothetical protein GSR72_00745 [Desulfurococcales archaeon]|nr:hypothetical protein [Desulfurococcales archaeon]